MQAADKYGGQVGLHHSVDDGLRASREDPDNLEHEETRLHVRVPFLAEELEQGQGRPGALEELGHVPIQKPGDVLSKLAHLMELGLQFLFTQGGTVLKKKRQEFVELTLLLNRVRNLVVVLVLLLQCPKTQFLGRNTGRLRFGRDTIPG